MTRSSTKGKVESSGNNTSSSQADEEAKIMEFINKNPKIINNLNEAMTAGRKTQQAHWDMLGQEFDCSADTLKKFWTKARQRGITKKTKEPIIAETMMKTKSNPLKRNLFFRSTDISCASSACGSPPKQVIKNSVGSSSKRAMRSLRRSMCMIKEQEKLDTADNDDDKESVAESNYDDANEEKKNDDITSADANADDATLDDTETESLYSLSNVVVKDFPEKLGLMRRRSMRSPVRHSEPGALLRSSLIPQTTTTSSRRSVASSVKSTNTAISDSSETKIGSILKAPRNNKEDSTRCFFESMGLTVVKFPQHVQARVKNEVSKLIHELEYDLNNPVHNAAA
uniref:MADF domain-containing protein n=1 Tax=Trichogramma kaykai TaxID=54128 RepID=A0ABD2WRA6_9HYME